MADRVRVKMPGKPKKLAPQAPGGVPLVMHQLTPDNNTLYAVAWSEGELPPERRSLPSETLLNDSCNGAVANSQGATEESRTSITLRGLPGKKLVLWVPQARGRIVMCMYFNERSKRLYMAMAGGKGLDADSKQVRWFMESLEIREADPDRKDAPRGAAPAKDKGPAAPKE